MLNMSNGFTRREAIGLLGLAGLAVAGCASEEEQATTESQESELNPFRCGSGKTDRAVKDGETTCPPELRRYEKIVVLMMENRSFDHYFGHLSLPRSMGGEGRKDVDGLTGNEVQFLDGQAFKPFKATNFELGDIDHSWDACHGQFNDGKMDGFIRKHFEDLAREKDAECGRKCGDLRDPMAYYGREDTPVFHQLLDNYALCDRWFSSVMGPTWPNRFYLHAGTSCGIKKNRRMDMSKHPDGANEARTIWHELNAKCVTSVNYSMDFAFMLGGFGLNLTITNNKVFGKGNRRRSGPHETGPEDKPTWSNTSFEEACEMGLLPTVSMIDPAFIFSPCDDHPPHDIKAGQAFVASIYKLLTKNEEQWAKTLFLITYDEHGSFYDHVAPPKVREEERPEFQQLGFRVPALVIGPYVKKNFVSHTQYDHVSFLSTVTRRLGLDPLNARVAAANDVRDCIDMNAVETASTKSPISLLSVPLSESKVHASIAESHGQSELADLTIGGPASLEQKRRATDEMLAAFDRIGVARIRR